MTTPVTGTVCRGRSNAERTRVVLVDDDDAYRSVITAKLAHHGIEAIGFANGHDVLDYFASDGSGDVIALDWTLPDVSGIDLLARLRHRGVRLPLVFLTINASVRRERLALARGAVDFIGKSRGVAILAQRFHRIVLLARRVPEAPAEETIRCGALLLRPHICRAYWKNIDINLTLSEFKVVQLLTSKMDEYVSPREIYDCMHYAGFIGGTGEEGYRTNVRSAMRRIRRKFHALDPGFDMISTLPIRGYQWSSSALADLAKERVEAERRQRLERPRLRPADSIIPIAAAE
ncbi:MAG TPA: response regulator transcription factor [Vineibacter sp.]|nr:response regulator transcription factor [Vineibacter sp.]